MADLISYRDKNSASKGPIGRIVFLRLPFEKARAPLVRKIVKFCFTWKDLKFISPCQVQS